MKKLILLALTIMAFTACQKTKLTPGPAFGKDTIADGASFTLKMARDSDGYEYPSLDTADVLIHFNHIYHLGYSFYNNEDGGVGLFYTDWHFTVLSDDGGQLGLDGIPYKPGVTIPVSFAPPPTPQPRYFVLNALRLVNIPADMHIWCVDNHLKNTIDLRKQPVHFHIDKTDTTTYGNNRFQIVVQPY